MVKYKLIRKYPGSPKVGTILTKKEGQNYISDDGYFSINPHYIENDNIFWQEVKELTLLEEAKLRYPIGTKIRSVQHEGCYYISNNIYESTYFNLPIIYCDGITLYYKDKWAEIVDDFVLPEKWCIKQNISKEVCDWFNKNGTTSANIHGSWTYLNYPYIDGHYSSEIKSGCTEITFEQFKKYVLKEEKVVEKDYEILEVKGKYGAVSSYIEELDCDLKDKTIFKVKRIGDGEVFTIGDIVNGFDIEKTDITVIRLQDNKLQIGLRHLGFYQLNSLTKYIIKQPLFTTEDGVDIFKGDNIYGVKFYMGEHELKSLIANDKDVLSTFLRFSTKEKAEEYILMNKPLLSLSDVWDNLRIKDRESMLKFVKQKLNK